MNDNDGFYLFKPPDPSSSVLAQQPVFDEALRNCGLNSVAESSRMYGLNAFTNSFVRRGEPAPPLPEERTIRTRLQAVTRWIKANW